MVKDGMNTHTLSLSHTHTHTHSHDLSLSHTLLPPPPPSHTHTQSCRLSIMPHVCGVFTGMLLHWCVLCPSLSANCHQTLLPRSHVQLIKVTKSAIQGQQVHYPSSRSDSQSNHRQVAMTTIRVKWPQP